MRPSYRLQACVRACVQVAWRVRGSQGEKGERAEGEEAGDEARLQLGRLDRSTGLLPLLPGRFPLGTAPLSCSQIGQYVLAAVMTDLEEWEKMTIAYEEEEAALGTPTEPLQEGRLEGLIHEYNRQNAKPPVGCLLVSNLSIGHSVLLRVVTRTHARTRTHSLTHTNTLR